MPVPNQSAANGTQAIGAMKRSPSKIGDTMSSSSLNQPISKPRGMPTNAASTMPHEIALEARRQMLRQRRAGKRRGQKLR